MGYYLVELNRDKKSLSCVLTSFSYFPSLLSQRIFVSRWHFFHHPNYPWVSEWTLWSHGTLRNSSQAKSANKLPTNLSEHDHSNCPKGITYVRASGLILKETMEKAMATHFSTLAWKIPWEEEPGRLLSMGSLRVGHDWSNLAAAATACCGD